MDVEEPAEEQKIAQPVTPMSMSNWDNSVQIRNVNESGIGGGSVIKGAGFSTMVRNYSQNDMSVCGDTNQQPTMNCDDIDLD